MNIDMPRIAYIAPGVNPTAGANDATGFYRWQAFQFWLEKNNDITGMKALDAGSPDPIALTMEQNTIGHYLPRITNVPACTLPSSMRVVAPSATVAAYLSSQGAANTATVIVATYPVCQGASIVGDTGATLYADSETVAVTEVTPGVLTTIAPFGIVWVPEPSLFCGDSPIIAPLCSS